MADNNQQAEAAAAVPAVTKEDVKEIAKKLSANQKSQQCQACGHKTLRRSAKRKRGSKFYKVVDGKRICRQCKAENDFVKLAADETLCGKCADGKGHKFTKLSAVSRSPKTERVSGTCNDCGSRISRIVSVAPAVAAVVA